MSVQRVFVEKRQGFDIEARRLQSDLADFLGDSHPELARLKGLRVLNRYDVSGLDEALFEEAVQSVFSEAQSDTVFYGKDTVDIHTEPDDISFAIEYLPGQYNQRADSAEQCVELVTGVRPLIRSAIVYILTPGDISISQAALEAVKKYLINPVDSREASAVLPETLEEAEVYPNDVPILTGFITANNTELDSIAREYGLAMNLDDLRFCREWFASIKRNPTLAELRVLDTYWSDHCRHTTFNTILERIEIGDGPDTAALNNALALYESVRREVYGDDAVSHPHSLWDMATIGAKVLRKRGLANDVDVSKEINACTIKVNTEFSDGLTEPWLLLFKNETHNHPTEIEPFGGAATCLGGAIRDPLSGRAFVHQAMRISGGGDPRASLSETMPGKLPQLKIAREAAAGYSSYGNQIGLPTGQVAELYHRGFLAKRMELGAVIAAVPAAWVRREEPESGDLVILVGGKTGRDGIGGATGSSKIHSGESVETAGAEVQKGNAVEERKLQRLFRNPQVTRLIKRCNDFGAGGVSVAVGELAAGLDIDLDKVPKKYAGLDGVELAISESQERMAVVCAATDADAFINFAAAENLDAVVIATITANDIDVANASLKMNWRGKTIVDLARTFLNTNGAPRSVKAIIGSREWGVGSGEGSPNNDPYSLVQELTSLRSCSRRGLQERFDGSIGAGSVLFPWGGAKQGTPECGMAALLPSLEKQSVTASLMTFGCDPDLMELNPYEGAKGNIREALAKFVCLGGEFRTARLSLQEYFERPVNPESWGRPAAALLSALEAQLALGIPAIGGKDSMSGNYRDPANGIDITVPPILVSFAAGTAPAASVRSGALSGKVGNVVVLLAQNSAQWDVFKANMDALAALGATGSVRSAYPVAAGGVAVSLALMAFGNDTGLEAKAAAFTAAGQGSALVEIDGAAFQENPQIDEILKSAACWEIAAITIDEPLFRVTDETNGELNITEIPLAELRHVYEYPLAKVYPQTSTEETVVSVDGRDAEERKAEVVNNFFKNLESTKMQECVSEWISQSNIERAKGKTREEIFCLFGNELEPIAYLPYPYLSCLDTEIVDNRIYCGKGCFLDHVVNHHSEVNPAEYLNIQQIINYPDDVKLDERFGSRKALIFIKKTEKYGVMVIGVGKTEKGKLFFYKSFFRNNKSPYPRLRSIRTCSSLVDGFSTISHMESIPAGSLSALNDTINIPAAPQFVKRNFQKPKLRSSPLVILPVFPGTNCEWDMERAFREAGARTRLVIFRNRSRDDIAESKRELAGAINEGQILALSGGFSAGDEPEGSGKFIANVLRSGAVSDAVNGLIQSRDGLILGICNGFQALIKLGLVPYGGYRNPDAAMPTLTFNRIGRHVSRMVRTRVMASNSPWLALEQPGAIHLIPVSHGEGRIVMRHDEGEMLFNNNQVPFCYADVNGQPTLREPDNPNGSDFAIEGLCSPDGRILGKMGHSERRGEYVHINIPGNKRQNIFEAGVRYFTN
jgi:phosphoribosylformylglycinamidine synthase